MPAAEVAEAAEHPETAAAADAPELTWTFESTEAAWAIDLVAATPEPAAVTDVEPTPPAAEAPEPAHEPAAATAPEPAWETFEPTDHLVEPWELAAEAPSTADSALATAPSPGSASVDAALDWLTASTPETAAPAVTEAAGTVVDAVPSALLPADEPAAFSLAVSAEELAAPVAATAPDLDEFDLAAPAAAELPTASVAPVEPPAAAPAPQVLTEPAPTAFEPFDADADLDWLGASPPPALAEALDELSTAEALDSWLSSTASLAPASPAPAAAEPDFDAIATSPFASAEPAPAEAEADPMAAVLDLGFEAEAPADTTRAAATAAGDDDWQVVDFRTFTEATPPSGMASDTVSTAEPASAGTAAAPGSWLVSLPVEPVPPEAAAAGAAAADDDWLDELDLSPAEAKAEPIEAVDWELPTTPDYESPDIAAAQAAVDLTPEDVAAIEWLETLQDEAGFDAPPAAPTAPFAAATMATPPPPPTPTPVPAAEAAIADWITLGSEPAAPVTPARTAAAAPVDDFDLFTRPLPPATTELRAFSTATDDPTLGDSPWDWDSALGLTPTEAAETAAAPPRFEAVVELASSLDRVIGEADWWAEPMLTAFASASAADASARSTRE